MMRRAILGIFLIFASSLLVAEPGLDAEPRQSLDLLKQKVESYVLKGLESQNNAGVQVTAERIDPRLNLKPCKEENLEVFNPYQTSILRTTTMGIRCQESKTHWTLYVPIKINLQKPVLVAKHRLQKGAVISENDVEQSKIDINLLKYGHFSEMSEVVGQVCRQAIEEGTALSPSNLTTPLLIRKGEQVSILAGNESFSVTMQGIAMANGSLGDIIKIKNRSSKKLIEAQVSGERQVRVAI